VLSEISTELAKQGKIHEAESAIQEALECARSISYGWQRDNVLKDISTELIRQGNWTLAIATVLEISQIGVQYDCWKEIAESTCKKIGWQKAFRLATQFNNGEPRLFYLKGWVGGVNLMEVDSVCLKETLSHLATDSESIENLLQTYALQEVFFGNGNMERLKLLNRTLNIQWAINIKAQFPKPEAVIRLSTNLDAWLHEISDADDREEIELWARRVAKGKITEEAFAERLNNRGL
jgi:hypothetical protein